MEAALWRWRDKIVADTSKAPNGVAGRIHVANSVLHDLAALQIVPPVARLTKPRNYRKNIKHRPTLVEPPLAQQAGPRSNAELIKSEEEDFKAALAQSPSNRSVLNQLALLLAEQAPTDENKGRRALDFVSGRLNCVSHGLSHR